MLGLPDLQGPSCGKFSTGSNLSVCHAKNDRSVNGPRVSPREGGKRGMSNAGIDRCIN